MAFDGICVSCLTKELQTELLNGRITKIAQPEADELLLTIKTQTGQKRLCISASASLPLIYLTQGNKPSPMTAPNFCMLLRKHLNNGRIVSITQPKLERIIELHIEHLDELGDLCKKKLIVELMGKHSNLIFCTEDNVILDSIKHVPSQMSSIREVLPGRTYFIPDTMQKTNPLHVSFQDFSAVITDSSKVLRKALYTGFTGISPMVAEEVCFASQLDSSLPTNTLTADILLHLYRQFTRILSDVENGTFAPRIYLEDGEPKEFSAIPLQIYEQLTSVEYASISELLAVFYATKSERTRIRQKSAQLRQTVQTALERNRKKYDLQHAQLKDTLQRDTYRIYGELLHTYGYQCEANATSLDVINYYTNEPMTIPLDPTKNAMENAARYFEKYNKQKRTFEALNDLICETKDEITYLESIKNALDIARTETDLSEIKEELITTGYVRRKHTNKKVRFKNDPLHYVSSDGFHMYVGKNNLQNDALTFDFAVGNDWWFHAKDTPGSHVIVKTHGEELPDRTFEEAGALAAYYSKARGSEKVEIDYVEKKHVKKPKGAKPGFVVYYTNYSLITSSDISSLQEISSEK